MKRFIVFLLAVSSACLMFAQLTGNGFYRVKNYGTGYYLWVCDNTGSIDYARTNADMGAMQLWPELDKAISEPASVIYLTQAATNFWDAQAQGTGVNKMIGHYLQVHPLGVVDGKTLYEVFATDSGITLYLFDVGGWGGDYHAVGTTDKMGKTAKRWIVEPIDANTDSYFGVKPTMTVGGKHYAPFYADFAFSFASAGMKAYIVSAIEGNFAIIKPIETEVVPASTPVIIECSSADKSDNRLNLLYGSYAAVADNKLAGVYFCNEHRELSKDAKTAFDASSMRVLHVNSEGKLVFDTQTTDLHVNWWYGRDPDCNDTNRYLNANQSYLPVAVNTPAELTVMTEAEYAEYKANLKYNVTYMVDGQVYKTSAYKAGETISPEATPVKEGYTFSGWSEIPGTMPAKDVVVTGTFSVNSYKVTFMYGNNVLKTITVEYGATIPLPTSLDSERYTLVEWLEVPTTMPAHDVTIYANYEDGIDWVSADGKSVRSILLNGVSENAQTKGIHVIRMSDGSTKKVMVK